MWEECSVACNANACLSLTMQESVAVYRVNARMTGVVYMPNLHTITKELVKRKTELS